MRTGSSSNEHAEPAGLNWAGNYRYRAATLYRPKDVEEVRSMISGNASVKALGSRHSFNDIADSPSVQISTEDLTGEVLIDPEMMTATVESGLRYGHFCAMLDEAGFALHNLASLPHISVAGACATATHGSGAANGNLATAVEGIEFVDGTGTVVSLSRTRDADVFNGSIVNLGALGIVTRSKLRIQKRFDVAQNVFLDLPIKEAAENFNAIMSAGYSVSMFTTFRTPNVIDQIWIKRRTDREYGSLAGEFYGAAAAAENVHPIREMPAENCTEQLGVPGPWYERLPHFRMGYTPSSGAELQSEYFLSRENAAEALLALESYAATLRPYVFTSEIRTIAGDDLWMSPSYKRESVAFHFTWKQDEAVLRDVIPGLENLLSPFDVRPHWGKLYMIGPAALRSKYEMFEDFVRLADRFDPEGKFRNVYLDRLFRP